MTGDLDGILQDFAREVGQIDAQQMGARIAPAGAVDIARANTRMTELAAKNAYIMQFAVSMVILLFVACVVAAVYYRSSPQIVLTVMGGNALQLIVLVGWLRRLWIEKTAVETLLVATEALPPADAAKILLAFYFKALKIK